MKEIEVKEIIKHLMAVPAIVEKVEAIYWGLPMSENKEKPYAVLDIVSDIPDPIRTMTRLEVRIIANNEKVLNSQIQEIDNLIKTEMLGNFKFGTFVCYNIIAETGRSFFEDKDRKTYIRDYIIHFIN